MNATRPPRVATWFLHRLVAGPNRESLIGDLVEQYQHGRSAAWFWRQVLGAIAAGVVRDVRAHYVVLPLVAFFIGCGTAAVLGTVKLLPGLPLLDHVLAGLGAAWLVGRIGGTAAVVLFASFVLAMDVAVFYASAMSLFDHFRGAWLIAHYAFRALPSSIAWAQASILIGGLWGVRPHDKTQAQSRAS